MKLYVAGPMRGLPEFNFPAFHAAAGWLRQRGHEVFSPAERDVSIGFIPDGMAGTDADLDQAGFSLRQALAVDLAWICQHAEGVVLLDGWEASLGAAAEIAAARALGLPVYTFASMLAERLKELRMAVYQDEYEDGGYYYADDYRLPPRFRDTHPGFDCGAVQPDRIYPIEHGAECRGHPRAMYERYSDEWMWTYVRTPPVYFRNDPNTVRVREEYL